jgi:predicted nuclease of predicted toxin-antitoxin system
VKLLVDMNLSPSWVDRLAQHGFEAVHWSTIGCDSARLRNPDVGERARLRPYHERSRLLLNPRRQYGGDT